MTPQQVLGDDDGWAPLAQDAADAAALPAQPAYLVSSTPLAAAPGQQVFATLPAALAQLQADLRRGHQPARRAYIGLAAGVHAGPVIVPRLPVPLTLYGLGDTPDAVRLQADSHAGLSGAVLAQRAASAAGGALDADNAALWASCTQRARIGTGCSAVLQLRGDDVQLRRLTVANHHGQASDGESQQAVALMAAGADRLLLADLRLLGHQDTLYLRRATPAQNARIAVLRSLVAGDIDFIFGNATAWFEASEIRWLGERGRRSGHVAAPSTPLTARFGFVFHRCHFSSDGQGLAAQAGVALARQWFEGAGCSPYAAGHPGAAACRVAEAPGAVSPAALAAVGRMWVLHSTLGDHLRRDAPWAPWQDDPEQPLHRPVQWQLADAWARLQRSGLDPAALGWPAPASDDTPWLAEHANQGPGALTPAVGEGDAAADGCARAHNAH